VPIKIRRVRDLYDAEVTTPHGNGVPWRSPHPMRVEAVIGALIECGCHQTDIGDAFTRLTPTAYLATNVYHQSQPENDKLGMVRGFTRMPS
jgi:hypothetical protein